MRDCAEEEEEDDVSVLDFLPGSSIAAPVAAAAKGEPKKEVACVVGKGEVMAAAKGFMCV